VSPSTSTPGQSILQAQLTVDGAAQNPPVFGAQRETVNNSAFSAYAALSFSAEWLFSAPGSTHTYGVIISGGGGNTFQLEQGLGTVVVSDVL
jgi:hypothetical protein